MKKKPIALIAALSLVLATACTPRQQQDINNTLRPNQGQTTGDNQQVIQGVESSVNRMGDIKRIKITSGNADVRSGCSNASPVIQTSGKDNTLDVVSQVADWFAVKLPNNQFGFVPKTQAKPVVVEDKQPEITPEISQGAAPQTSQSTVPKGTTPKTPTAQTNSSTLSAQEQEMLKLINQARAQNNVPEIGRAHV